MLLLKCPKCGHEMRCSPKGSISGKKKRCVYCGKAFKIEGNIVKEISLRVKAPHEKIKRGKINEYKIETL